MNITQNHDFLPATTGNAPVQAAPDFDDQDTLTIQGTFAGRSEKGMWITCPDRKTRLFAFSRTHVMSGEQRQGAAITVQIKGWMYRQAFIRGEQRQTTPAALPAPPATNATAIGRDEVTITMNTRMLKRLVWLCDPAKHQGAAIEQATIARGFLMDVAGGVQ